MNIATLRSGQVKLGIVARTQTQRRQIVDALNLLHLEGLLEFANFFELAVAIDKKEVDWVLCTYLDEEGSSLLDQLPEMTHSALSSPVYCFALLKPAEQTQLPQLFNAGLFGWGELSEAPDAIADHFYRFMKLLEHTAETHLAALASLEPHLRRNKLWQEALALCEAILHLYPHSDQARLLQIEAYIGIGELGRAEFLLRDMELYDPEVAKRVATLRESLLGENENHHKLLATQYAMETALIVDPQAKSLELLQSRLRELGFRRILAFTNGEDAAAAIKGERIHFALLAWECPGLSGPYLLQRIREEGNFDLPILIITEMLDRADTQLVKDMGVAYVLKKPVQSEQLTIAAAWAISQAKNPTEAASIERKILGCLGRGDRDNARYMYQKLQSIPTRDPVKDKYIKACLLYSEGRFKQAKDLLIEATHMSKGDNVRVAAMLAKCLMRLGDTKAAVTILKKVSGFSPKNIERLCSLAEVAIQDNDLHVAEESLIEAEKQDPGARVVTETKVKLAAVTGQTDLALDLMKLIADAERVVSYMNNLAVASVKSAETAEGIRLYKNCQRLIPQDRPDLQAIVAYNLGLALIKNKEHSLGSVYIKQALAKGESPVLQRAKSLLQRFDEAKQGGPALRIVEEPEVTAAALGASDLERIPLAENLERLRRQTYLLQGLLKPAKLPRQAS